MIPPSLLLGTLPPKPAFSETIIYQFNGLLIVFMALGGLWILMEFTGALFRRRDARLANANATSPATVPASATVSPHADDCAPDLSPDPEILAVISAAVCVSLFGRNFRVLSVKPEATHHPGGQGIWAIEGRREIFTSHKVR